MKGTIHWVSVPDAVKVTAMLYENLIIEDENSENGYSLNPNSLTVAGECMCEPSVKGAKPIYRGQQQPKVPLNKNYYNLLDDNVLLVLLYKDKLSSNP